ncbi:unnamed protein product [Kuraishia capsulata CBS 1993]|uniref:ADP,ATP carrier protein n=1 Tax=Kuraishia capsulata CBS 1993 TaxID=1382522 RepID=W6MU54_9ASCO|nr:uncharacterized protein KUCA_T00004867001 [Kuraishia capsulata CBS 1993]CDK28882.1 unnamed protein product [Kuraishia capsulata CBS 1993]
MVGYIALISMVPTVSVARIMHRFSKEGLDGLKDEYRRIAGAVGSAYQKSLFAVMKSSWITTPIAMAIAQNYLSPNIWVVFFNVVYFVLGTYNNTLVKISRKQQQIEEKAADKEPV